MGHEAVTFDYNEVERVLAKAFGIHERDMSALRGRLNNFRKLGFAAKSPGTGHKILYQREHIYQWALGLEFCEFGVNPRLIGWFVKDFAWPFARQHLLNDGPEKLFVYYANSLSGWSDPRRMGPLVVNVVGKLSELEEDLANRPDHRILYRRCGVINLGRLRWSVEQALAKPD